MGITASSIYLLYARWQDFVEQGGDGEMQGVGEWSRFLLETAKNISGRRRLNELIGKNESSKVGLV